MVKFNLPTAGRDARFDKGLCCSSLNSFYRNPLTIDDTGFLTLTQNFFIVCYPLIFLAFSTASSMVPTK
jgi:hypothetical protein